MLEKKLSVGDRIAVGKEIATIRFVGAVPPTPGEWLGVEWDNPSRGKHNGSKDGVQYFICSHNTSGSFLRESKVNRGVVLIDALKEKYEDDSVPNQTISITSKRVEMVGCENIQKLETLRLVSLNSAFISSPGLPGQVLALVPDLVHLSLEENLLSCWEDIHVLTSQLLNLKHINLSCNRFIWKDENDFKDKKGGSLIETVVMNNCNLNWKQAVKASKLWPNVKFLGLTNNVIKWLDLSIHENCFEKLEQLELNGNPISTWDQIKSLNCLKRLEKLQLDRCGFEEIDLQEDDLKTLKSISLNSNNFESPSLFNDLNRLLNLQELFFFRNPINSSKAFKNNILEVMVAKISKIRKVNNMPVTSQLRGDSEMDYLRLFGAEWRNSGGHQDWEQNKPNQQFLSNHPRYMDLIKAYGAPQDSQIFKQTTALKSNLIELKIIDSLNPSFKPITRKLPRSMKISSLRQLVQKLTKTTDMQDRRLVYVSKNNDKHMVALDRIDETLHDVSIENGDLVQLVGLSYKHSYSNDDVVIDQGNIDIESDPKLLELAYDVKPTGYKMPI